MKLAFQRSQSEIKGTFGGHKGVNFSLNARAILSPEEERLIEHYRMGGLIVHEWMIDRQNERTTTITINDLRGGKTVTLNNIGEMMQDEQHIKQGCQRLKSYLDTAKKFGGEEIIEI